MAIVLVVDDNNLTHMLMDVMLRRLNHQIVSAYNGNDAFEFLKHNHVDLVVSDIDMPSLDGLTLLDYLRKDERYENLPVIIMTANGRANQAKEATDRGATIFLNQPFRSDEFSNAVRKCLEESYKTNV